MDVILVTILVCLICLPILGLYVWSIVWAYRDAECRGKSGMLVSLLVMLVAWPGRAIGLACLPTRSRQTPHLKGLGDSSHQHLMTRQAMSTF
jgi:hypothetical protein